MQISVPAIFSFLIAFQLLFVAVFLLLNPRGNRRNNALLGGLFLLIAINMADFTLRITGMVFSAELLHFVDDGFVLLYGPLLYLYVNGIVFYDFKIGKKQLLHFIPFLLYLTLIVLLQVLLTGQQKQDMIDAVMRADLPRAILSASFIIYTSIFLYLWLAWKVIRRYRTAIKNKFSSLQKINLNWLNYIIRTFAVVTLIAMLHNAVPIFGSYLLNTISLAALLLFLFYFIHQILFKALNQQAIFSGISMEEVKDKYAGSSLKEEEIRQYAGKLEQWMTKEKPYLNANLAITDLAEAMQLPVKSLSQVINQHYQKNFFDFVNTFRCEEFKRIMKNANEKMTVLEALYASGFNSKSSFNKEFKKLTGQTPTEYRKSIHQ
jgi:AraC-like DNA-binding protein